MPKNKNPLENFVRGLDYADAENRRFAARRAKQMLREARRLREERLRKLLKKSEDS